MNFCDLHTERKNSTEYYLVLDCLPLVFVIDYKGGCRWMTLVFVPDSAQVAGIDTTQELHDILVLHLAFLFQAERSNQLSVRMEILK